MKMLYSLRHIEVCLGERFRLMIPELDLCDNEIYLFTGPNGAGKSTLLRLLAFLNKPGRGEIWFRGRKVCHEPSMMPRLRKSVTMVDQSPYLFSGSVYHNLAFGLRMRGLHGSEIKKQTGKALELVGLSGFESRKVQELSGGEAQRVALARALALNPEILILDEPTANIDRLSLAKTESVLAQLPEQGVTVIMTSHDDLQTRRIGGKVISVRDGRLDTSSQPDSWQGPMEHIKENAQWPLPLRTHEI